MDALGPNKPSPPHIVATGFTTAFLGDERTLREFIAGDHLRRQLALHGDDAVLYLINDTYDPLSEGQLRVGVRKDAELERRFAPFCGRPIAEVPDPYECHPSYAAHFAAALLGRLRALGIHPVLLDTYSAYRRGDYAAFVAFTFENYTCIRRELQERFAITLRNLFRPQCKRCGRLDCTNIRDVRGQDVRVTCSACGIETLESSTEIPGKLNWKLACAVRWNLYHIDTEVFSKSHVGERATSEIARFLSEHFYGGNVPVIVPYGKVRIERELSNRLLDILPPELLKELFTAHLTRDLLLTRDSVETFCRKTEVRAGTSYVDFVRRMLPELALSQDATVRDPGVSGLPDEAGLVACANRFSDFYYGRRHEVRFPAEDIFRMMDGSMAQAALQGIRYALSVRNGAPAARANARSLIRSYLHSVPLPQGFYSWFPGALGISQGPNVATLLAILPETHLGAIQTALALFLQGLAAAEPTSDVAADAKPGSVSKGALPAAGTCVGS